MTVERTYHCDGPDCRNHATSATGLPATFLRVTGDGTHHFCQWDCVMRYAAQYPTETVSLDGEKQP